MTERKGGPTPLPEGPRRFLPYEGMTGEELALWRLQQPGSHIRRNGQEMPGWSQAQAADWYGVSERTWRRYENTGKIPRPLIKRARAFRLSMDEIATRILQTPKTQLEEWNGVHEKLKDERGERPLSPVKRAALRSNDGRTG